jgi:hypothetical protein
LFRANVIRSSLRSAQIEIHGTIAGSKPPQTLVKLPESALLNQLHQVACLRSLPFSCYS